MTAIPSRTSYSTLARTSKEAALEAKADESTRTRGAADYDLAAARALAYYEVITTLQQTLEGFDIPASATQLEGIDADRGLL